MNRKMLIEITEEEYEKIKGGVLDKDPEVETREIPKILNVQFKFKEDDKVSFVLPYNENERTTGKIVGFIVSKVMPGGEKRKDFTPVYLVEHTNGQIISFIEEKNIILVS